MMYFFYMNHNYPLHITDATGSEVILRKKPLRIISLVPSLTELIFDLGAGATLVGRTRYCIHPGDKVNAVPVIGGTKKPRIDRIRSLNPDLIIAAKEENRREDVELLRTICPVYTCDIQNLDQAIEMIRDMGRLCDAKGQASVIIQQIEERLERLKTSPPFSGSAVYLIWENPLMAAGGDTFIHAMMERAGFSNLLAGEKRYPVIQMETLQRLAPRYLLLSSEPYPFGQKEKQAYAQSLPDAKILLVDGTLFSWYGSRIVKALLSFT